MQFPSTQWSQLALASLHGDTVAGEALEGFYTRYRGPVISFMRWRQVPEDRIEDLTHDFFLQLLTHSALKRADRERGKFRAYLTGALVRFLASDVKYNQAQKRGGGDRPLSLERDFTENAHPVIEPDDQAHLDREWGLHVFRLALGRVKDEYVAAGKEDRFTALRAFLPGAPTADEAAARASAPPLALSVVALRTELHRLRERFRECLRHEVAQTVETSAQIDEEMAYLRHLLSHKSVDAIRG